MCLYKGLRTGVRMKLLHRECCCKYGKDIFEDWMELLCDDCDIHDKQEMFSAFPWTCEKHAELNRVLEMQ